MADYFVYIDETGTLDFREPQTESDSPYFGIGSATFKDEHADILWNMLVLRASLEDQGISLPRGFHAKNDSMNTRAQVFALLSQQPPVFHATFLYKSRAYSYVQQAGKMWLYKLALYEHVRGLCQTVFDKNDHLYLVLATFGTKSEKTAAETALLDISNQMPQEITPCYWDSASSSGLQIADYMLWGLQRRMSKRDLRDFEVCARIPPDCVRYPWGV